MVSKDIKDLIDILLLLAFGYCIISVVIVGDYYYMDNVFESTITDVVDIPSNFRAELTKSFEGAADGTPFAGTMGSMSASFVNMYSLILELLAAVPASFLRDFTVLFKEWAFGTDVCYYKLK